MKQMETMESKETDGNQRKPMEIKGNTNGNQEKPMENMGNHRKSMESQETNGNHGKPLKIKEHQWKSRETNRNQ